MASTIGARVKALRERRGLSQAELVAGLPVAHSYVSLIERDRRQPSDRVLAVIAERLGCTADYLLTGRRGPGAQEMELELRFAELALRSGDLGSARDRFEEVLRHAVASGLEDVAQDARWGFARAKKALGDFESTIDDLEELNCQTQFKGSFTRAAVAMTLAHTYLECSEVTRAIEVAESALAALVDDSAAYDDQLTELASTLVACYFVRGDLSRAHLLARRVITEAEQVSSPRARAAAYWNAGVVAEGRGDLRTACIYTERALALYGEDENLRSAAVLRVNYAWLILRSPQPDPVQVEELLNRAIAELSEVGTPADVARAESELARCRLLVGDATGAVQLAASAVDRLSGGRRLEGARARLVLARAELAAGDIDAAVASYKAAATILTPSAGLRQAAVVWRELGDDFFALGMPDEAVAAYRHAFDAAGILTTANHAGEPSAAAGPRRQHSADYSEQQ